MAVPPLAVMPRSVRLATSPPSTPTEPPQVSPTPMALPALPPLLMSATETAPPLADAVATPPFPAEAISVAPASSPPKKRSRRLWADTPVTPTRPVAAPAAAAFTRRFTFSLLHSRVADTAIRPVHRTCANIDVHLPGRDRGHRPIGHVPDLRLPTHEVRRSCRFAESWAVFWVRW